MRGGAKRWWSRPGAGVVVTWAVLTGGAHLPCAAALELSSSQDSEEALFESYQRSLEDLKPLAQIEAWLGYLRLHPDTPHHRYIRARLRFLAAELDPTEEGALVAGLVFQQLPAQLAALEDVQAREAAAESFVSRHPEYFYLQAHHQVFIDLLQRMGIAEPDALVARVLRGRTPGKAEARVHPPDGDERQTRMTIAGESPGKEPATTGGMTPGEAAGAAPSGPVASSPAGAEPSSSSAAASGTAPEAGVGVAPATGPAGQPGTAPSSREIAGTQGTPESGTGAPSTPTEGIAAETAGGRLEGQGPDERTAPTPDQEVAALPSPGATEAGDGRRSKEDARFARWVDATAGLSPEAERQIWTTYLLLYPDSPHIPEVQGRIAAASEGVVREQEAEEAQRELAAKQAARERQHLEQRMREQERSHSRFRVWSIVGMVAIGLLALMALD